MPKLGNYRGRGFGCISRIIFFGRMPEQQLGASVERSPSGYVGASPTATTKISSLKKRKVAIGEKVGFPKSSKSPFYSTGSVEIFSCFCVF